MIAPISSALTIIQRSIGNTPFAPVSAVLGSTAYLLQACQSVSKSFDAVELLFQRVSDLTTRFAEYDFDTVETALKSKVVDILAYVLEINGKAEAIIRRKRFRQWFREILLQDDDLKSSLDNLKHYIEQEIGLVVTLTYGRVKAVQQLTSEVKAQVEAIATNTQNAAGFQATVSQYVSSESESRLISETFYGPTFDELINIHHNKVRGLTQETGYWLAKDPAWHAWTKDHAPLLWVLGKPGVGKSMLAARTIEVLQETSQSQSDDSVTAVAFMYFKDDDFRLQNFLEMLKAVAFQIAGKDLRFKKHLLTSLVDHPECVASSRLLWKYCFLGYYISSKISASSASSAYMIVDGLDEAPAPQRAELLDCLAELVQGSPEDHGCKLQVMVSCRPEVLADVTFCDIKQFHRTVRVNQQQNSDDIRTFIRSKLNNITILKVLKSQGQLTAYKSLAKSIYVSVDEKADGMFLWASLMLDDIKRASSPESIMKSLQQAPAGLDEMLHHIFMRLSAEADTQDSYMFHLFAWMASTEEPLTLAQLYILIHATSGHRCITLEEDLQTRLSSLFDLRHIVAIPDGEDDQNHPSPGLGQADTLQENDFDFLEEFGTTTAATGANESLNPADNDDLSFLEEPSSPEVDENSMRTEMLSGFEIPKSWHKIRVKFSHSRIKGYLQDEGNPSSRRWNDCSIIPTDLNEYKAQIVQVCLRTLRSGTWDPYRTSPIEVYCRLNWMKYCRAVNWPKVPKATRTSALNDIAAFCSNWRSVLASSKNVTDSFIDCWYSSDEYPKAICAAFADDVDNLDPQFQSFVRKAVAYPKYLLEPFVTGCAEAWLTTTGEFAEGRLEEFDWTMVSCIAHFLTLREDGSLVTILRDRPSSVESIVTCAHHGGFPQDNTWCKAVGWAILNTGDPDTAQTASKYLRRALDLCTNDWSAWHGLANVFGRLKNNYKDALDAITKAIEHFPAERKNSLAYASVLRDKSVCLWCTGNAQQSWAAIKEAFEISYKVDAYAWVTNLVLDQYFSLTYVDLVAGSKNSDELMEFVRRLQGVEIDGHGGSLFTLFLRQQARQELDTFFERIARLESSAAKQTMNDLMKEALPRACNVDLWRTGDMTRYWLTDKGGAFLERSCWDTAAAIQLYEHYLSWSESGDGRIRNEPRCHSVIETAYGAALFKCAVESRSMSQSPVDYVNKLRTLVTSGSKGKQQFSASGATLAYSMWLRIHEEAPEYTWRAAIRPMVMQQLYLLSDDNPYNDQEAYSNLGRALICAGDVKNASIAWGIVAKPYEKNLESKQPQTSSVTESSSQTKITENKLKVQANEQVVGHAKTSSLESVQLVDTINRLEVKAESKESDTALDEASSGVLADTGKLASSIGNVTPPENPKYTDFAYWVDCDGPCGRDVTAYSELWTCKTCIDVDFCDECIGVVRSNKLPVKLCSSTHEFVRYFPLTKEAKAIADPLVRGDYEPLQEWLDRVRKNWN